MKNRRDYKLIIILLSCLSSSILISCNKRLEANRTINLDKPSKKSLIKTCDNEGFLHGKVAVYEQDGKESTIREYGFTHGKLDTVFHTYSLYGKRHSSNISLSAKGNMKIHNDSSLCKCGIEDLKMAIKNTSVKEMVWYQYYVDSSFFKVKSKFYKDENGHNVREYYDNIYCDSIPDKILYSRYIRDSLVFLDPATGEFLGYKLGVYRVDRIQE